MITKIMLSEREVLVLVLKHAFMVFPLVKTVREHTLREVRLPTKDHNPLRETVPKCLLTTIRLHYTGPVQNILSLPQQVL